MRHFFLILCCVCGMVGSMAGQGQQKLERVKTLFYHAHYDEALSLLKATRSLQRDKEGQFLMALCYYQLNELTDAKDLLEQCLQDRSPYPEALLYLARVYHAQHQFTEATQQYKLYLRTLRPNHEQRPMVIEEIRRCDNGIRLQYRPGKAVVENLGPAVNTPADEFAPVLSPNHATRLYFSSLRPGNNGGLRNDEGRIDNQYGHPLSDLYSCDLQNGQWKDTEPMTYLLNSPQHEVLLDFSAAGRALLFFKGNTLSRGQILIDTFQQLEQRSLNSVALLSPINADQGDRAIYVYNDTLMLFASRRSGGYGGLDIWKTSLRYGIWGRPENLGARINSVYDETTPFLARDGRTLYFSSNDSKRGIGGLDILKAVWLPEADRWSEPENLGLPINSAADDAYFRLSQDGFSGFFASARKDGYGQRDLYAAYFQDYLPEMEAPVAYVAPSPVRPPIFDQPVPPPNSIQPAQQMDLPRPPPAAQIVITPPAPPLIVAAPAPTPATAVNLNVEPSDYRIHLPTAAFAPASEEQQRLAGMIRMLTDYPTLKLVITAYTPRGMVPSDALYEGLVQAGEAAEYFIQQGISFDRFYLRSLLQKETDDWQLEFAFTGTTDTPLNGKIPVIGGKLPMRYATAPFNAELAYKVQIVSVQKPWKNQTLQDVAYPMAETVPGFAFQRITVGAFPTFAEAERLRQHLRTLGYNSAFTVPYINGWRADKNDVKRKVHLYPDLQNYLGQ